MIQAERLVHICGNSWMWNSKTIDYMYFHLWNSWVDTHKIVYAQLHYIWKSSTMYHPGRYGTIVYITLHNGSIRSSIRSAYLSCSENRYLYFSVVAYNRNSSNIEWWSRIIISFLFQSEDRYFLPFSSSHFIMRKRVFNYASCCLELSWLCYKFDKNIPKHIGIW